MYLTDLREFKKAVSIDPDDTSEDATLLFCIEWASAMIEEYLDRKLTIKQRTEYYNGTATQQLQLRARPVYSSPTPQVWVDESGFYGSASGSFGTATALAYGTDFCLRLEGEDGAKSRSGLLVRLGAYWPRPSARQRGLLSPFLAHDFGSVKVTYTAGYTPDELPPQIRLACNLLANRIRYIIPLSMELGSESYEERHVTFITRQRDYLMSLAKPLLHTYRNWRF